jgi:hypothetical protein
MQAFGEGTRVAQFVDARHLAVAMRAPVGKEHRQRQTVLGGIDAHGVAVEVLADDHRRCRFPSPDRPRR